MTKSDSQFTLLSLLRTPLPQSAGPVHIECVEKIFLLPEHIERIVQSAKAGARSITLSTDIGLSDKELSINEDGTEIQFANGTCCTLQKLPKLKKRTFYHVEDGELRPFHFFCERTSKVYKLLPTGDMPSFSISSAPMHQITRSTPAEDTKAKIAQLQPIKTGDIALDTCFGLGYSSGLLATQAGHVVTCEFDSNSLEVAKVNPYSRKALKAPNLTLLQGDIFELVKSFRKNSFQIVLHDPPTPKIAPLLYSSEFYKELKRVLVPGGKLYHYTPRPNIQKKQRDFPAEVKRRLKQGGFQKLVFCEAAQGLMGFNSN